MGAVAVKTKTTSRTQDLSRAELERRLVIAETKLSAFEEMTSASDLITSLRRQLASDKQRIFDLEDELQTLRAERKAVPSKLSLLQQSPESRLQKAYDELISHLFIPGQQLLFRMQDTIRRTEELQHILPAYEDVLWWLARKHSKVVRGKADRLFKQALDRKDAASARVLPAQKRKYERQHRELTKKAKSFLREAEAFDRKIQRKAQHLRGQGESAVELIQELDEESLLRLREFIDWVKKLSVAEKNYRLESSKKRVLGNGT